jgi:hypothetical protein
MGASGTQPNLDDRLFWYVNRLHQCMMERCEYTGPLCYGRGQTEGTPAVIMRCMGEVSRDHPAAPETKEHSGVSLPVIRNVGAFWHVALGGYDLIWTTIPLMPGGAELAMVRMAQRVGAGSAAKEVFYYTDLQFFYEQLALRWNTPGVWWKDVANATDPNKRPAGSMYAAVLTCAKKFFKANPGHHSSVLQTLRNHYHRPGQSVALHDQTIASVLRAEPAPDRACPLRFRPSAQLDLLQCAWEVTPLVVVAVHGAGRDMVLMSEAGTPLMGKDVGEDALKMLASLYARKPSSATLTTSGAGNQSTASSAGNPSTTSRIGNTTAPSNSSTTSRVVKPSTKRSTTSTASTTGEKAETRMPTPVHTARKAAGLAKMASAAAAAAGASAAATSASAVATPAAPTSLTSSAAAASTTSDGRRRKRPCEDPQTQEDQTTNGNQTTQENQPSKKRPARNGTSSNPTAVDNSTTFGKDKTSTRKKESPPVAAETAQPARQTTRQAPPARQPTVQVPPARQSTPANVTTDSNGNAGNNMDSIGD